MENVSILSYDDKDINIPNNVTLSMPSSIQGGSYFTKIYYAKRPMYMQSPKCVSKQGVTTVGKKMYVELVISNEKDGEFISFLENLEKTCIDIIYEKRHIWFTDELEKTDIETAFASIMKSYKNGTSHLLKLNINSANNHHTKYSAIGLGGLQTCFIFDENNNALKVDDIQPDTTFITIIEFEGIKFTSKSFQFEINARQILIVNEKPLFNSCLIKPKKNDESNEKVNVNTMEQAVVTVADAHADAAVVNEYANDCITTDSSVTIHEPTEQTETRIETEPTQNNDNNVSVESLGELKGEEVKGEDSELETAQNDKDKVNQMVEHEGQGKFEDEGKCESELVEVNLDLPQELDSSFEKIKLQDANDVYYKMYKEAKEKAKSAKKMAVEAYLAAEEIKFTYNLVDNESDSDDSESDNNDNESESDDENGDNGVGISIAS
jgi:hypothetical protein